MTRSMTHDIVARGGTRQDPAWQANPPEHTCWTVGTEPASNQRQKPRFEQWPAGIAKPTV